MDEAGSRSDCEDAKGGQIDELAGPPTLPAAPATPRSPRLVRKDPHALAKQFFGVSVTRSWRPCPFMAKAGFKGRSLYLGCWREVEDAARAHDAVARLIPGRQLNFPSGGAQRRDGEIAASDAEVHAAAVAVRTRSDISMAPAIRSSYAIKPTRESSALGGAATAVRPTAATALRARGARAAREHGKDALAAAAAAAASDDGRGRIDERPPARRKRPRSPTATLPPLTRADLLVLVRVRLRAACVDDSTVDLENVSESGLRAMLDDIQTRLSLR